MMTKYDCDYCDENYGGSHYHCANCLDPKPCGSYGHWSRDGFTCEYKGVPVDESQQS